jgi:Spy/CpxP family protein refolding chaperone
MQSLHLKIICEMVKHIGNKDFSVWHAKCFMCQVGKEVKGMKRTLVIGLAVALVFIIAAGAMAFGPGYHKGTGPCYGAGSNLTPEQSQKLAEFNKEIVPLRQKMHQLMTDVKTLHAQPTPDWKAIANKEKEIVDVRTEIHKKATEAGVAGFGHCLHGHGMGKDGNMQSGDKGTVK